MNIYTLDRKPEQLAVILAKYSRSAKSAKETSQEFDDELADKAASKFISKYVDGYGHDSIRELAVQGVCIEGVSQIVIKIIEAEKRGAYSEQSTRYQTMTPDLVYNQLEGTEYEYSYKQAISKLFWMYNRLLSNGTWDMPFEQYADYVDKDVLAGTIKAYAKEHKTQDTARYCLPMGLRGNLAAVMDARAWSRVIVNLRASVYPEAHEVADKLVEVLSETMPTLVKHTEVPKSTYDIRNIVCETTHAYPDYSYNWRHSNDVEVTYDGSRTWLLDIMQELSREYGRGTGRVFSPSDAPMDTNAYLKRILGCRKDRHDPIPEAFGIVPVYVSMISDIGAWRDMQRHRPLTQFVSVFTMGHRGYSVPRALGVHTELRNEYVSVMEDVYAVYRALSNSGRAVEAEYLIPFATRVKYDWYTDLRELMYICELRSQQGGHYSYRAIVHQIAKQLIAYFPMLSDIWSGDKSLVDWKYY